MSNSGRRATGHAGRFNIGQRDGRVNGN